MNKKDKFVKYVWPRIENFFDLYSQSTYQNWYGPYIWNENGDINRIITRFCEEEYGFLVVHNETVIAKYTSYQFEKDLNKGIWEKEKKKSLRIDLDITDARHWENNEDFKNAKHELFIEIKGLKIDHYFGEPKKKILSFKEDCERLKKLIDNVYCKYGIAILIDQGNTEGNNYVQDKESLIKELQIKYNPVIPLIWQKSKK